MFLGDPQMFKVKYADREEVWAWAKRANIRVEYNGTHGWQDVWRVVNPKHCAWFEMRWM